MAETQQRRKKIRPSVLLTTFVKHGGNLEVVGEILGREPDKLKTSLKNYLREQKFNLEWAGKPIPVGEEGYKEGENLKYPELVCPKTGESTVETTKRIVAILEKFPVLTKNGKKGAKTVSANDTLAAMLEAMGEA